VGSVDIVQLQEEVQEKNEQLQTLLTGVVTENVELKKRLTQDEERVQNLEKALTDKEFMISLREELYRRAKVVVMDDPSGAPSNA